MAYLLTTTGNILRKQLPCRDINDIKVHDINPEYVERDEIYQASLGGETFLIMHGINDVSDLNIQLPINQTLRRFFPDSPYVGDILAVRTFEDDTINPEPFDLDNILNQFHLTYILGNWFFAENSPEFEEMELKLDQLGLNRRSRP